MANRYWVGGTASWNGTAGSKWATTSGGAGGAAVPTSSDDVFFDANSGAVTVTVSATANCNNLDFTGFTGTFAGAFGLVISGSLTMAASMTRTFTGTITFNATSTGKTIAFNGITTASGTTFNGVGGGWTLQDAWNNSSNSITLTNGSLNTNGQSVTTTGSFLMSNSNVRSLTLGASTISVATLSAATTTNLTFDAGTSEIILTSGAAQFNAGGLTYHNVTISSMTGDWTMFGVNTFNNLTVLNTATRLAELSFNGNAQTINGTLTFTGNSAINRLRVGFSTITAGAVALSNCDFNQIIAAGAAIPWTGTNLIDLGGNSNITFTAQRTLYWVGDGGDWSDTTHWSLSSGGPSGENPPTGQDTAVFDANSFSSAAQTVTGSSLTTLAKDITFAAVTNNPALSFTTEKQIYGSLTMSPNMTIGGSSLNFFFNSPGAFSVNMEGLSCPWQFVCGYTDESVMTITGDIVTSDGFEYYSGVLNAGSSTITPTWAALYGTINLQSSIWVITDTGSSWYVDPDATINAGSSIIEMTDTSATAKSFWGSGKTYNTVEISGDNVTIKDSNTFNTLYLNNAGLTNGTKITAGTTQTIANLSAIGTDGNLVVLQSSSAGTPGTLTKPSGQVSCDYLSIKDSTATGGASWYAGANSTNVSGNTGWIFTDPPTYANFLSFMN